MIHHQPSHGLNIIMSGHKHEDIWAEIGEAKIWGISHIKLLGMNIDNFHPFVLKLQINLPH